MMNYDAFFDTLLEARNTRFDYSKASREYFKRHGHGVNLDRAKTEEERHIDYLNHYDDRCFAVCYAVFSVLGLDKEQIERARLAERALDRWYNTTKWERIPPEALLARLWNYIIG